MVKLCFDVYRIFPWEWLLVPLYRSPCLWYVLQEKYIIFGQQEACSRTSVAGCIWLGPVLCGDWMDDGWTDGPELPAFWDSDAVHHSYSSSVFSPGRDIELLQRVDAHSLLFDSSCQFLCTRRSSWRLVWLVHFNIKQGYFNASSSMRGKRLKMKTSFFPQIKLLAFNNNSLIDFFHIALLYFFD